MPRPTSKPELLEQSQLNFKKLNDLIGSFSEKEQNAEFPKGTMNRNIRDVLAHIHHWHLLFLGWYNVGMEGGKPDMPAKGYTWKTTPELNREIWNKYKSVNLAEARRLLNDSHEDIQAIIKKHSNQELFEKKRYKWTGTTSLGAYLVSATSSHYEWGFKLVKKSYKIK